MSSNRVPANQFSFALNSSWRGSKSRWIGLLPILVLSLGLGGCALNSSGLPGGLPVPPGGGTLTISRFTLMNGIQGRTYAIWIPTSGGTGTLAAGGCTIISGALPAGLAIATSDDNIGITSTPATTVVRFCKITGTITAGAGTTVSFTVQAADTAVPANTASQAFSILVRPDFAVTTVTAFLNGVNGRTYGNPAAPDLKAPQPVVTSASATVGNAPVTCLFSGTAITNNAAFVTAPAATPAGPTANTCNLGTAAAVLTTAGAFNVSLAATDSDLMDTFTGQASKVVVPKVTKSTAAPLALTVNAALGVTLTQNTNPTPTAALLNAVQGRSYGTIGGTPTYAAVGGLTTTGNYNWCVSVSPLPAGFVTGPVAVSTNCAAPTAIATATSVTVTSPAAGAATVVPTAFTLLAGDTGNAAVPALTTAATVGVVSNTAATNLTINALLNLAVNLADPLPDAVTGRTYGGAGFTSIIYTASLGAGAYNFTPPPTGAAPAAGVFPAPMSCVAAATTLTCSSAALTGTPGAYTSAPAKVDDAGNTAVPGSAAVLPAPATATQTRTLNVRDILTFASINYASPLPTAVTTRSWGTGVGFTPLIYTAQNGLGGYSFAISGTAFPGGIACATVAATSTCDTTIAGSVTGAPGPYNGILVTPNDTANVTTPSANASLTQPPAVSRNLTVNPDITLFSVAPDPGNALTSTAVIGRTYGKPVPQSPPLYTFTGGLPGGYTITTPVIPGWMTCTPNVPAPISTTLTCDSGATTVTAVPSTLTINVVDTPNSATPAKSPVLIDSRTIAVNTALGLVADFNNPMPDAVNGRTYGGVGFKSPVYTASNGLGGYVFTLPGNSLVAPAVGLFPAPMSCAQAGPGAPTATCSSAPITGAAGNYTTIPVSVDDTANSTTPGSAAALLTQTVNRNLTVRPEFSITTVTSFLPGVAGRTYGNAPQSPQPVATDVSATVGNAPLTSCTFTVTPVNPGFGLLPAPVGTTCELSSGATTLSPANPAYNVSVSIKDTTILDPVSNTAVVPAGTVSNSGTPLSLTVNAILQVKLQVGSPDPTTVAGQAVEGRTYGAHGLFPETDVVYEVTGGLPGYFIAPSGTLTSATNIVCGSGATTSTCNSANAVVTNSGGTNPNLTVSATDTANGATPAGAASIGPQAWTVNPVISFSLAPVATGVAPNGLIPDGVVGRTYGTPLANLVFTATGGLANAAAIGLQGTQTGTLAANGINCNPTTPQVGVSVVVTCNSGGGPVTTPAAVGRTLVMTFADAGNSTTPGGATSTDNSGFNNYTNNIADILAIALQAGSPDPSLVTAQAVVGRTYGAHGLFPETDVVYEVTGGLPGYFIAPSGTLTSATNIVCVSGATTSTCNSANALVTNSGGTNPNLTISALDTANATTPAGGASFGPQNWTVNPAVTLTVTPNPADTTVGATGTVAVIGRGYGTSAVPAMLSPTYTASGGLSIYTYALSNPPGAGITCTSGLIPASVCSSAAVTAAPPVSFDVTVTDGGNLTTPVDAVGAALTRTFTVRAALTITTASLKNGLVNYTYAPPTGVTLAATGGLDGNNWVAGGPSGPCAPSGSLPTGLGLTTVAGNGLLSGIPTVASTLTTNFTFDVCVFDTVNATTPSGNDTHVNYLINVMDTKAYTANSGNESVSVFNTTSNASPATSIATDPTPGAGNDVPFGVAVSPDGRKVYVTLSASNQVAVIDTITNLVTTTITLGTCTTPQGIAIGLVSGTFPIAYVACTNGQVAVIDAAGDVFLGSVPLGSGGTFYGVATTPNSSRVYITDSSNNQIVVINALTVTEIASSPFPAQVTTPHGIAISADGNRVYIAGNATPLTMGQVIVLSTADNTTVVAGPVSTGVGSSPEALAVTPDALGAHVYVTLQGVDQFAAFDDTLGTPALTPAASSILAGTGAVRAGGVVTITTTAPHGLTFTVGQAVIIAGVTDASFDGNFAITSIPTTTTFTYAQAGPPVTSGSGTANFVGDLTGGVPWGVTIPPIDPLLLTASGFRVYIAQFGFDNVAIRDDETTTPFGVNGASPIALTPPATPNPQGLAHIPVPR